MSFYSTNPDGSKRLRTDLLPTRVYWELAGRPAPENPNTNGSRPASWATATVGDGASSGSRNLKGSNAHSGTSLTDGVVKNPQWGSPRAGIRGETHFSYDRGKHNIEEQAGASTLGGGKLNPRWVETLMGLPVGWTMPSCTSPVTIVPTNSDSLATESSLPPQP